MKNPPIAAISTAQGQGGIGVIRISGEEAVTVADRVFVCASGKRLADLKGYNAAFGYVEKNGEKIDEAVALVFLAPHSYTGENVVEISCHGGLFITKEVLRTVIEAGAKPAQAGEFTKRAFLNGKIDLAEAESVMDIIGAKNTAAARAALVNKEGILSKKINGIKEELIDKAAHLAAWADYPEEDIPEISYNQLMEAVEHGLNELNSLLDGYDAGQVIKEGIDTVIAGKPNVGKSTLMNLLTGTQKSIVTEIPGTTRDIIEETVTLGNVVLRLSDTAGIRNTDNKVEKIGVEKAIQRLKTCGLLLAVFDSSMPLEKEDYKLIEDIKNVPSVAVINKSDLEKKIDSDYIEKNTENVVYISAGNASGLQELVSVIEKITGTNSFDPSQGVLSNERQRNSAFLAKKALEEAKNALEIGMTFDAVTVSIEEAISELLELTGENVSDEIVDKVFHNFCVGK
ncbi:MAG: tRNA uridine-5-carboxymethylaminomethyl(34) synthesis GTPase MnmE [Ruminococcus sp.]|nr:tRNA uridine-5-carboxymethylaminomethyl(34) synthesis GTPase MnmE [Ruminococcus sp.]